MHNLPVCVHAIDTNYRHHYTMNMAAVRLQITVTVVTMLVGVVSGQCPAVTNCFSNMDVDTDRALNSLQLGGVMDTNVTNQEFAIICQNIDQLMPCYELLPDCPELSLFSSFLPSSTQIRQLLTLLCQHKEVLLNGFSCMMSSGTVDNDVQACMTQVTNSLSGMTQPSNLQLVVCRAYDSAISCLTTTFQRCGSDFSTVMTNVMGYMKPSSCKQLQDISGGQGITGCVHLGIITSFLIWSISRWF